MSFEFLADPNVWLTLVTLSALEIVLGVDNLVFPEGEFRLDIQIRTVPVNGDRSAEALLDELALS